MPPNERHTKPTKATQTVVLYKYGQRSHNDGSKPMKQQKAQTTERLITQLYKEKHELLRQVQEINATLKRLEN